MRYLKVKIFKHCITDTISGWEGEINEFMQHVEVRQLTQKVVHDANIDMDCIITTILYRVTEDTPNGL